MPYYYISAYPRNMVYKLFVDGQLEQTEGAQAFIDREPGCLISFFSALEFALTHKPNPLSIDYLKELHKRAMAHFTKGFIIEQNKDKGAERFSEWRIPTYFDGNMMKKVPIMHSPDTIIFDVRAGEIRPVFDRKFFNVSGNRVSEAGVSSLLDYIGKNPEAYIESSRDQTHRKLDLGKYFVDILSQFELWQNLAIGEFRYHAPYTINDDILIPKVELALDKYNKDIESLHEEQSSQVQQRRLICMIELIQELERIHPFSDGNGRVIANILMIVLPMQYGLPPVTWYDPNRLDATSIDEIYATVIANMVRTDRIVRTKIDEGMVTDSDDIRYEVEPFLASNPYENLNVPMFNFEDLIRTKQDRVRIFRHLCEIGNLDDIKSFYATLDSECKSILFQEPDENGLNILFYACSSPPRIMEFLLSELNIENIHIDLKAKILLTGDTLCHFACKSNNVELIKYLYSRGAILDTKNQFGFTPLQYLIRFKNENDINWMLEHMENSKELIGFTILRAGLSPIDEHFIHFSMQILQKYTTRTEYQKYFPQIILFLLDLFIRNENLTESERDVYFKTAESLLDIVNEFTLNIDTCLSGILPNNGFMPYQIKQVRALNLLLLKNIKINTESLIGLAKSTGAQNNILEYQQKANIVNMLSLNAAEFKIAIVDLINNHSDLLSSFYKDSYKNLFKNLYKLAGYKQDEFDLIVLECFNDVDKQGMPQAKHFLATLESIYDNKLPQIILNSSLYQKLKRPSSSPRSSI